jgi:hypothetical protein
VSVADSLELCGLMRSLQVKADVSGVDTGCHAHGLQGSFLDEARLSNTEMANFVETWTAVEDDPRVAEMPRLTKQSTC